MPLGARARWVVSGIVSLAAGGAIPPASAQVVVQQVDAGARRPSQNGLQPTLSESDYILGSQAGGLLLNPSPTPSQLPGVSQARSIQIGNNNVSNIDMSGSANIATQFVLGNRNTVTQQQSGSQNSSNVNVFGYGNTVGTQQQDVNGASATINVQGNNNTVSAEQVRNSAPVSISQVGNNGSVSVSVTRK